MDKGEEVWDAFLIKASGDCRMGPAHVALFAALHRLWRLYACPEGLDINVVEVMRYAKFHTAKTYYCILKELHEYHYLRYEPSFCRKRKSKIYMNTG